MKPLHDAPIKYSACQQGDMISVTDIYIDILHTHLLTIIKKAEEKQSYLGFKCSPTELHALLSVVLYLLIATESVNFGMAPC